MSYSIKCKCSYDKHCPYARHTLNQEHEALRFLSNLIEAAAEEDSHQGGKQMVEDEVNGHHRSPHVTHCHQGLVHDIYPALLGQDLEHGHECLQGGESTGQKNVREERKSKESESNWVDNWKQGWKERMKHREEIRFWHLKCVFFSFHRRAERDTADAHVPRLTIFL